MFQNQNNNCMLIILFISLIPINLLSLITIIKYKGDKNQRLTNCAISDGCTSLPSYESQYSKNIKEETEYINNELVYTAELQWSIKLNSFKCMFSQCSNIISIDLNNFDTSSCTDMIAMFRGCSSLISIILIIL